MSERTDSDPETPPHDEHDEPRGTVAMMVLFGLLIVALWVWMYLTLLERG